MISVLFALDHEAALFRRGLSHSDSFRFEKLLCVVGADGPQKISLGVIGMGAATAAAQTAVFLQYFRPRLVILTGYAGALRAGIARGEVFLAENHARVAGVQLPPDLRRIRLESVEQVVTTRAQREALHQSTQAGLVDLETAAVAAEVARHQIPFLPLRAVSDALEDDLPASALAAAFDSVEQRPTPARLLCHLFSHPADLPPFVRFVTGLGPARRHLTTCLQEVIRLNFTGS